MNKLVTGRNSNTKTFELPITENPLNLESGQIFGNTLGEDCLMYGPSTFNSIINQISKNGILSPREEVELPFTAKYDGFLYTNFDVKFPFSYGQTSTVGSIQAKVYINNVLVSYRQTGGIWYKDRDFGYKGIASSAIEATLPIIIPFFKGDVINVTDYVQNKIKSPSYAVYYKERDYNGR